MTHISKLSHKLNELAKKIDDNNYTWGNLHDDLGSDASSLALLLLSVPFLQPIPLPALSSVLGLLMVLLGINISLGKQISIPAKFKKLHLPQQFLQIMFKTISFILLKAEYLIRPRAEKIVTHQAVQFLAGLMIIISSLFLSLPLPPGFNFPPALVCFLLALGLIEKDLALILIGSALFLLEASMIIMLFNWIQKFIYSLF